MGAERCWQLLVQEVLKAGRELGELAATGALQAQRGELLERASALIDNRRCVLSCERLQRRASRGCVAAGPLGLVGILRLALIYAHTPVRSVTRRWRGLGRGLWQRDDLVLLPRLSAAVGLHGWSGGGSGLVHGGSLGLLGRPRSWPSGCRRWRRLGWPASHPATALRHDGLRGSVSICAQQPLAMCYGGRKRGRSDLADHSHACVVAPPPSFT